MKTASQTARIRAFLNRGKTLTAITALHQFSCLRLSGRILELRRAGMNIQTRMVNRNGKRIALYSL